MNKENIKTKIKSTIKKYKDILIFITILLSAVFILAATLALTTTDKDARHAFDLIGMHKSQIIKIKSDDIIPISISKNNHNQILISGKDIIKSIKNDGNQLEILKSNSSCNNNLWLHYEDDADKNIYCIRFLKQDKPVTILITTEKDVTYKLLLVPTSVDPKTIIIERDICCDETEFRIY
jgi:hypothetical protein